jgi:hypothetical protein
MSQGMTENERIAKVLGWERKGLSIWWHAPGFERTITLPDWTNDIAACFCDLVPWMQQRMADAKLGWVHCPFALRYEPEGNWECEIAYPDTDPLGDYVFEQGIGDTPAAAICAAFLAAFEVQQ